MCQIYILVDHYGSGLGIGGLLAPNREGEGFGLREHGNGYRTTRSTTKNAPPPASPARRPTPPKFPRIFAHQLALRPGIWRRAPSRPLAPPGVGGNHPQPGALKPLRWAPSPPRPLFFRPPAEGRVSPGAPRFQRQTCQTDPALPADGPPPGSDEAQKS